MSYDPVYKQWFKIADSDHDGRIVGKDAVAFFSRSALEKQDLSKVWTLADAEHKGFLDFEDFKRAMQFISLAQSGKQLSRDALKEGDILPPQMKGLEAEPVGPSVRTGIQVHERLFILSICLSSKLTCFAPFSLCCY